MGTTRKYEGAGFAVGGGELFEFGRDELPKGYGKGMSGRQQPRQGFSADAYAPAAPKPETLLQRAQRRQELGLELSREEQGAVDAEIDRKVFAGAHLTMGEERRLVELMASLDADDVPGADPDDRDLIDRMANL